MSYCKKFQFNKPPITTPRGVYARNFTFIRPPITTPKGVTARNFIFIRPPITTPKGVTARNFTFNMLSIATPKELLQEISPSIGHQLPLLEKLPLEISTSICHLLSLKGLLQEVSPTISYQLPFLKLPGTARNFERNNNKKISTYYNRTFLVCNPCILHTIYITCVLNSFSI